MQKRSFGQWLRSRFHFQFGIRARMRKDMIVVGSMFAITLLLPPVIGEANATSSTMGVLVVFISTFSDYTLEPVKNTCKLLAGTLGVTFAAFLGYSLFPLGTLPSTILMTAVTFVAFLSITYLFTSEVRGNFFLPLLLDFSVMLFSPVYGWDLAVRFLLDLLIVAVAVLFQIILYRNKFRKKIRAGLDGVIQKMKDQVAAIKTREHPEQLAANHDEIEGALQSLRLAIGPQLAQTDRWQHGHDIMRTLHILGRIHRTLSETYLEHREPMTDEAYRLFLDLFDAIDRFENDEIDVTEVLRRFDLLFSHIHSGLSGRRIAESLRLEAADFLDEEVRREPKGEPTGSLREKWASFFNVYTFRFALKTACVAAFGVFITGYFHLENASMYIMTISVLAQPYTEVGRKKVQLRIIHTIYALAMYIIAFSVPGNVWVHIALLLAMIFIGDMFLQFETNVIGSTMMVVVIRTIQDPNVMWSLTAYRIAYVVSAAVILLAVDLLLFPNRLGPALQKQTAASLAVTRSLRAALSAEETDEAAIRALMGEKRRANQRIRHINQFVQDKQTAAYLVAEEAWLNRLTLLLRRLALAGLTFGDVQRLVRETALSPDAEDALSPGQKSFLISLQEIAGEIPAAEALAAAEKPA